MGSWDRVKRIEIVAGRYGFFNLLNGNRVPLSGLTTLLNATLADYAWRTGGGAATLGVAIGSQGLAAIDYWPTSSQQRTLVICANGHIYKDDGTGNGWTSLAAGLANANAVPMFSVAGYEIAGKNRKVFYADRVNAPLYLDGDGAAMAALDVPSPDWAGANQPGWFIGHQGFNWAGGNANAPHTVYRSLGPNHADFGTQPTTYICGPLPNQERTVGAIPYKGGLIIFCYPVGVYFMDTTTDPNPLNWNPALVAQVGCAGPRAFAQAEDDVIYLGADGSWHSLASVFGQQKASIQGTDLAYRALSTWAISNVNPNQVPMADLIYYSNRRELLLAYAPFVSTVKSRRLHADLNNVTEAGGPNWVLWDRDDSSAMFLRKVSSTLQEATIVDSGGQLWRLDQVARNKGGNPYRFEFFLQDSDLGAPGRKKNGRFFQVEYVATSQLTLTMEAWYDGALAQTTTLTLAAGVGELPMQLPAQLGPLGIQMTPYQRLLGSFKRIALRGYVTGPANADCVITKLVVGAEMGSG